MPLVTRGLVFILHAPVAGWWFIEVPALSVGDLDLGGELVRVGRAIRLGLSSRWRARCLVLFNPLWAGHPDRADRGRRCSSLADPWLCVSSARPWSNEGCRHPSPDLHNLHPPAGRCLCRLKKSVPSSIRGESCSRWLRGLGLNQSVAVTTFVAIPLPMPFVANPYASRQLFFN